MSQTGLTAAKIKQRLNSKTIDMPNCCQNKTETKQQDHRHA